jgi:hypothetical protein
MREPCDICGGKLVTDLEVSICTDCSCVTPLDKETRVSYKYKHGCLKEKLEREALRKK